MDSFLNIKAYKPIIVVTQNKIVNLKICIMPPLIKQESLVSFSSYRCLFKGAVCRVKWHILVNLQTASSLTLIASPAPDCPFWAPVETLW